MMNRQSLSWVASVLAVCILGTIFASGADVAYGGDQKAFPGAEGFGGNVRGGAGGKVIWVTHLDSERPGSLRAAIDTPGPRIIKFKVAGTIELGRKPLRIGGAFASTYGELVRAGRSADEIENPYSFVTIDGTSAPGPGITISGNLFIGRYGLKEVIVRNLRIRDNGLVTRSGSDCISIMASHVLIDHCSLQWARDEVVSPWYASAHDITVQWCIIGPGWGPHSCGFINGGGTDRITVHHCLFAHNASRNPLLCGNSRANWLGKYANDTPIVDFRNNVVYNWTNVSAASITAGAHVNMVGNLYIPGAESAKDKIVINPTCQDHTNPTVLYLKGNISPGRPREDMDEWADAGYHTKREGRWICPRGPWEWGQKRDTPFPAPPVITHSAEEAKALVLSQSGAWPRDPVDAGIVRTVLHGTGHVGVRQTRPSDFANTRPTARATARPAEGEHPVAVRFEGEGHDTDGKTVSTTWHFGDGRVAVGPSVTHTYAAPGEYVATLVVVDDRGMSGTASQRVSVGKDGFRAEPVAPGPAPAAPEPTRPRWNPPTVTLAAPLVAPPTEEDWNAAPRLTPFVHQATWKKAPDSEVDARVLHDAVNLYLRVTSAGLSEGSIENTRPIDAFSSPPRVDWERCGYIRLITFISPQHGRAPWYRFDVSPDGLRYDAKVGDRHWDSSPDWQITSGMVGDKWQLTAAVPFRALAARPEKGELWGLKLILNKAKDVVPIWPPVGSVGEDMYCAPHTSDPDYYAKVQFP